MSEKRAKGRLGRIWEAYRPYHVFLLALLAIFVPFEVIAACDATGLFNAAGNLSQKGRCDGTTGVFATILCFFESTLSSVLGVMYCAFQSQFYNSLAAIFATVGIVFGVAVFIGYIRLTWREAGVVIVKIAFVYAFATNSDYAIKIAAKFCMGMLQEGANFALTPLGGNQSLTQPDTVITGFFNFMSNPDPANLALTNVCGAGTCVNESILKIIQHCVVSLTVVAMALIFFMPIILSFLVVLLVRYLSLYLKSLLSYLTSIVILTFLFALSPIFFSFFLFRVTAPMFEQWLKFVLSFSLQSTIMFSFLALLGLIMQSFTMFIYGLLRLLRPYDVTLTALMYIVPISNVCSVCEYSITADANNIKSIKCLPAINAINLSTGPQGVAVPEKFPVDMLLGEAKGAGTATATMPTDLGGTPISYKLKLGSVIGSQVNPAVGDTEQDGGRNYVIPLENLIKQTDFMFYLAANIFAFLMIASVLREFIDRAPELSQALGGVGMAKGAGGKVLAMSDMGWGAQGLKAGVSGFENAMMRDPFNVGNRNFGTRLREAVMGRTVIDRADFSSDAAYNAAKKSAPVVGGFMGGLMSGLQDEGSNEYQRKERELKAAQRKTDKASNELQSAYANLQESEESRQKLQDKITALEKTKNADPIQLMQARNALANATDEVAKKNRAVEDRKKTLAEQRNELRKASNRINANPVMKGLDEEDKPMGGLLAAGLIGGSVLGATAGRMQTAEEKRQQRKDDLMTGRALPPERTMGSSGMMPVGYNPTEDKMYLISAQERATKDISDLERKLAVSGRMLEGKDRDEYIAQIDKAKRQLGYASSSEEVNDILANLAPVEKAVDQYSQKTMLTSAATSGVTGIGDYMKMSEKMATSPHLKPVQASFAQMKDDFAEAASGKEGSEARMQSVIDRLSYAPVNMFSAVANSLDGQKALAERLVPRDSLKDVNEKLKQADIDIANAKEPADYNRILNNLDGSSQELVSSTLGYISYQQNMMARMTAPGSMKEYDKKVAQAREDFKHARTGDEYERILQDLLSARKTMMENVITGTKAQVDRAGDSVSPQTKKATYDAIDDSRRDMENAETGDGFDNSLKGLGGVMEAFQREQRKQGFRSEGVGGKAGSDNDNMGNHSFISDYAAGKVPPQSTQETSAGQDWLAKQMAAGKAAADAQAAGKGIRAGVIDPKVGTSNQRQHVNYPAGTLHGEGSLDLTGGFSGVWDRVKSNASALVPDFEKPHGEGSLDVSGGVSGVWDRVKANASGYVPHVSEGHGQGSLDVSGGVTGVWDRIKDNATKGVPDFSKGHGDGSIDFSGGISGAWDRIKTNAGGLVPEFHRPHGEGSFDGVGGVGNVWDNIKTSAQRMVPNLSLGSFSLPNIFGGGGGGGSTSSPAPAPRPSGPADTNVYSTPDLPRGPAASPAGAGRSGTAWDAIGDSSFGSTKQQMLSDAKYNHIKELLQEMPASDANGPLAEKAQTVLRKGFGINDEVAIPLNNALADAETRKALIELSRRDPAAAQKVIDEVGAHPERADAILASVKAGQSPASNFAGSRDAAGPSPTIPTSFAASPAPEAAGKAEPQLNDDPKLLRRAIVMIEEEKRAKSGQDSAAPGMYDELEKMDNIQLYQRIADLTDNSQLKQQLAAYHKEQDTGPGEGSGPAPHHTTHAPPQADDKHEAASAAPAADTTPVGMSKTAEEEQYQPSEVQKDTQDAHYLLQQLQQGDADQAHQREVTRMLNTRVANIIAALDKGLAHVHESVAWHDVHHARGLMASAKRDIMTASHDSDYQAILSRLEVVQNLLGHHH